MKDATTDPAMLVRRFYAEVWDKADEQVAREILHEGLMFRGSLGTSRRGVEEFLDYMRSVHAALSGYRCIIDDLVATDRRAAARMTFTGRHRASFFGVPPTGRQISWAGCAFFTTDGRQISEIWVLGDVDAIKQQLGIAGDGSAAKA
jgi:steroid delta-isomerase-like uncharacterized protein